MKPACLCSGREGELHCDGVRCDLVRPGEPYTLDQCRVCWLYFHDRAARLAWGPPMPGLLGQVVTFAQAALRHGLAGAPATPPDVLARRRELCVACPERTPDDRCLKCGCRLGRKLAWAGERCPLGKW